MPRPTPLRAAPVAALAAALAVTLAAALAGLGVVAPSGPAAASGPGHAPAAGAPGGPLAVTGFVLGSSPRRLLDRDRDALTQVDVVGASLSADGRRARPPSRDARRMLGLAQRLGLPAELLLSSWSNRLEAFDPRAAHRLLSHRARIASVADDLARTVRRQGWSGVNVDIERVRRSDAAGLVALVERLQEVMPAERTVSVDVSAATSLEGYRERGYDMAGLGDAADVVVLMAYDYHGPTWSRPGPIGPLDWQRDAVAAALEAVPADRVDLGVAGYGYTWPRRGTGGTVTPARARALVERDGVRARWHRGSGEWSAVLADGTEMWWSDGRSYRLRVRDAEAAGLHGVAVWRLGSADPL